MKLHQQINNATYSNMHTSKWITFVVQTHNVSTANWVVFKSYNFNTNLH